MKRIGILHGKESTFPPALVERINGKRVAGIIAEPVRIDKLMQGEPSGYAVILDRISQDVPFYRAYLKNAALNGTAVINNPFWWSADEKFFNNCLATKVGVAVPKTVLLPSQPASARHRRRTRSATCLPARLGGDLRLRRLPGLLQAARRRRLEERLQGARPERVLPEVRRDRPARDDAAGRDRVRGVLPLLRARPARGADHALRAAPPAPPALRRGPAADRRRSCSSA